MVSLSNHLMVSLSNHLMVSLSNHLMVSLSPFAKLRVRTPLFPSW
jgi:hypothetical protein